ncbi:hypothetical protein FO519_002007 [Halicephalobus sp. NKZ332]|nr:hypothetical protein FO519_002007 [Halicephalobus sp. NKZ332]
MISSFIEPSPTTSDISENFEIPEYLSCDDSSVDSWRWESTLDSCWRESECPTTTTDTDSSLFCVTVKKNQDLVWKKKTVEISLVKEKKPPLIGVKKIFKKCASIISNPLQAIRWHQVYQVERRKSIKLFNPVQLLTYNSIEDKLHPVEFVLNYLCRSVQDVQELRRNPQRVAHLIKGDVDGILQDAAFALAKMEQLNNAEKKLRRFHINSVRRQKRKLELDYIDPRF